MENKVKELVENGFAARRICKILNLQIFEVNKIILDNQYSLLHETFHDDKITLICDLYNQGVSAKTLGIKFSIDKRRIQKWAQELGVLRDKNSSHRFTEINDHVFNNIDSPQKAYWLGFLYADAYNSDTTNTVSISLQISDYDHLVKLSKFLGLPDSKIKYTKTNLGYEYYTVKMYSKHLCNQLTSLGCPRAKSFIITYPEWMPDNLHSHFIRGMFDGDGCLTFRENQKEWKWSLASTEMCCEVIQKIFLQKLEMIVNYHNISKTGNNTCELETSGNEKINKIMSWLYSEAESSIYLERKFEKFQQLIDHQESRTFSRDNYKLTDIQNSKILNMLKLGDKISKIAKDIKVHPRTVSKIRTLSNNSFEQVLEINGELLTASFFKDKSKKEREKYVQPVFDHFKNKGWMFPKSSDSKLNSEFKKLQNLQIDLDKNEFFNNGSLATNICKHFCESFYLSSEDGKKNMREIFEDDGLLLKLVRNRLVIDWDSSVNETFNITYKMMIQGMRSMRLVPSISIFKPAIAKYICEKYSQPGDIVGDYSCGFGGRFLGAMSCGRKYIGTDPLTTPELEKMAAYYNFSDYKLINSGSETYCGDENSIDLYWSSPPYFKQEYYSNDISQAYNRGEKYFYETYWANTLKNVKYMLKPGKWFGLNVKNYPKMLSMAEDTFGPIKEQVVLKTVRNHLNKSAGVTKDEYIYMFTNQK